MTIKSSQTINDWGSCSSEQPKWSGNFVDDYMGTKLDVTELLNALNNGFLSPQSGSGSPEGVIVSNYSLLYIDTAGSNQMYFNPVFGQKTGWVTVP